MNQTIHWQETAQGTEIFVGNCKIGTAKKLADTTGALDVFSIDKESSIPLLKGNLMLYYLTNKNEFPENAEKAVRIPVQPEVRMNP